MPSITRDLAPAVLAERLVPVLRDLPFPARRWQVVTAGDLYGCDGVTRELLVRVPEGEYATLNDLISALAAVLAGRPVPVSAPMRGPLPRPRPGHPGAALPGRPVAPARAPHRAVPARRPRMPRAV